MTQVKPKRAKILSLEDIYVRASRVELKCSFEGASQMEFFGTTHCPNPKTTSVAACAVPVKDYSHVPLGQPKSGVQVFHTPPKQKQAVDTIVCYDEGGTSNSRTSIRVSEDYVPNPPALSAAWKGRFEIHNYSQGLYLQAHPPEKVWCKAYKVLKQMPELVHLTLQSRHDVWPDTFKIDPPSVTDIALYFWADDFCRSSDTYNQLLQYMEKKDLSLRSRVDSVELFVFTSKQLPVEYQRLNRQSYLWGVFQPLRGKQLSGGLLTMPHLRIGEDFMKVTDKDDDQAVDMEIDMIGGEEIGRVDEYRNKTEFMARLDMASLYVVSEIQSGQPAHGCNRAKHHYQVKSEHCQDVGTSPRFSTSVVAPVSRSRISPTNGGTVRRTEACSPPRYKPNSMMVLMHKHGYEGAWLKVPHLLQPNTKGNAHLDSTPKHEPLGIAHSAHATRQPGVVRPIPDLPIETSMHRRYHASTLQ